mmetsp:Transcript_3851/g.11483  ORF Transcript_3851/g.11483 Transcript_3851/m.11483 type:complete len:319 (+) Transcript_3851:671-1627(+)
MVLSPLLLEAVAMVTVEPVGDLRQFRILLLQLSVPQPRHAPPPFAGLNPAILKVLRGHEILRDCHRVVEVEHGMPPPAWHKDSLSRVLHKLNVLEGLSHLCFEPREDVCKVIDGLIVLLGELEALALDHLFGHMWREENPPFSARDEGIPRRGAQWINVHVASGALGSNEKPSVGRTPLFANETEEVLLEVLGYLVIVKKLLLPIVLGKPRIEDVQWAVVLLAQHVPQEVLQLDPHGVAVIVVTDAKFRVAIALVQLLQVPVLPCRPLLDDSIDEHREVWNLVHADEVVDAQVLCVDPGYGSVLRWLTKTVWAQKVLA